MLSYVSSLAPFPKAPHGFCQQLTWCKGALHFFFPSKLVFLTGDRLLSPSFSTSKFQCCVEYMGIERVQWVLCLSSWHHRVLLNPQCHLTQKTLDCTLWSRASGNQVGQSTASIAFSSKGDGGVWWRRGESRAEWQVVGKQWVSHWLTRWKLNTGPRLVSQQESVCCLGASTQFIGHAGTLHLRNPSLIYMDFLGLIPDLRDGPMLLI